MGHVKTDKLDNGNIGLEITYGGHESPFGGVDTSAPPAYIDPKCFVSSDGFLIVDGKLCVCSFQQFSVPAIWNGPNEIKLIAAGTFYNSIYGQLNYALGYIATLSIPPAPYQVSYTFYMTSWNPSDFTQLYNDTLNVSLFGTSLQATKAYISLELIETKTPYVVSGAFPSLIIVVNSKIYAVNGYALSSTVASLISTLVTTINADLTAEVVASIDLDGLGITLTAKIAGSVGNTITVVDQSVNGGIHAAPPFYFTCTTPTTLKFGVDTVYNNPMTILPPSTTTSVGGVLYISNLGPLILSYSGLNTLAVLTMYEGVKVIRKFGGSLIGLGVTPKLGTLTQNQDMIFAWSAAEKLGEWAPVTVTGLQTGAGFAQLADIADFLTGLIVSNNTAFIIRSQGLSYATSLGSGFEPFQFAHVGLGDRGEGGQLIELVCQYDQTGAYVGNTDIFQISGSISSIGQKIKALLFSTLNQGFEAISSNACGVFIGGDNVVLILFHIGSLGFIYNASNQTWMLMTVASVSNFVVASFFTTFVDKPSSPNVDEFSQSQMVQTYQVGTHGINRPAFFYLKEGIFSTVIDAIFTSKISFPQEELIFGRDVTIDAIYIAFYAISSVLGGSINIKFSFNDVLFSTLTMTENEFTSLTGNPVELQIFPDSVGVFTIHSPQLQISVELFGQATLFLRFTKIQLYGSFDPSQRPV